MKIAHICGGVCVFVMAQMPVAYAQDNMKLPTISVMADAELRNEVVTTISPLQEDEKVRRALQHHLIKNEQDIQNAALEQSSPALNIQPKTPMPDMSNLTPLQQEYVLSVAAAFKSGDPSAGVFKILEPLGIDRSKALNHVQHGGGGIQITFDEQRLNQVFGDQWKK